MIWYCSCGNSMKARPSPQAVCPLCKRHMHKHKTREYTANTSTMMRRVNAHDFYDFDNGFGGGKVPKRYPEC